jgi:hypothetical protein
MDAIAAAQELRSWSDIHPDAHPADRARVSRALSECIVGEAIKPAQLTIDEQLTEWKIGGAL